jgi:hypothetical protein
VSVQCPRASAWGRFGSVGKFASQLDGVGRCPRVSNGRHKGLVERSLLGDFGGQTGFHTTESETGSCLQLNVERGVVSSRVSAGPLRRNRQTSGVARDNHRKEAAVEMRYSCG